MAKPKSLDDVLPPELREAAAKPLDDYMDQILVFHGCREVTGTHGVYIRLVVSLPDSEDRFYLATGASQAVEIMRYCKDNRLFPVTGKFVKVGRAIILKGS